MLLAHCIVVPMNTLELFFEPDALKYLGPIGLVLVYLENPVVDQGPFGEDDHATLVALLTVTETTRLEGFSGMILASAIRLVPTYVLLVYIPDSFPQYRKYPSTLLFNGGSHFRVTNVTLLVLVYTASLLKSLCPVAFVAIEAK